MSIVVAYKVGIKRVARVCADRVQVAALIDRLHGQFDELAIYADWQRGRIETCSLTRNKGCILVRDKPQFQRLPTDQSLPLVIAVKRQQP